VRANVALFPGCAGPDSGASRTQYLRARTIAPVSRRAEDEDMSSSIRPGGRAVDPPLVEVRDLSKRYGRRLAVEHLSFTLPPGRITGFLGPNGAGKSSTMRLMLGLDHPDGGTVTIGGHPYAELPRPLSTVGALLDANATHRGRSARNHLLALAQSQRLPRRRVAEVLDIVGLREVARRRAGGFSLGMGQRLGIAAALLGDPDVLVLDEPVNGLDPEGVLWIRTLLRRLAEEGKTVFISSHLMNEMAVTADHLIVIGRGRLIADCSTAEFIEQNSADAMVVRTPSRPALAAALVAAGASVEVDGDALVVSGLPGSRIAELAAGQRIVVHELTARRASLEDAFMALTRDSVEYAAERRS
jgi:ABC-2 type transport system ATP-binding protein